MPKVDDRDREMFATRVARWNAFPGVRVGDYVRLTDGAMHRISYLLTSGAQHSVSGSFHMTEVGPTFSGGLEEPIPFGELALTGERRDGTFWIFHHDDVCAHNDVTLTAPCRVFVHVPRRSAEPAPITDDRRLALGLPTNSVRIRWP